MHRLEIVFTAALIMITGFASAQDWPVYGGDNANSKYSALDQIDASNFSDLRVVWEWGWTGEEPTYRNHPLRPFIFESTPLVIDGVMYTCTSFGQVAAIDPATGDTLWTRDTRAWQSGRATNLGFVHRGVTHHHRRIYIANNDMKLWALDAKTGEPMEDFGDDGAADLSVMRRSVNKRVMQVTSPVTVCRGVVVVGSSIYDGPTLKEMPPGDVRGYDAKTGELRWTFHNPPAPGEFGYDTWKDGSADYTGNANVWTMMAADEELGYVYLPFGTPTNDWYGGHRKGDGLFGESLVCVDARTGERIWHFQTTHHGLWDYDLPAGPTLLDLPQSGGGVKKIVAQVTKQGFVFAFDRVTGEPLWPIEERAVPQSTAEGEESSPTQPFPTKPAPYELQGSFEDDLIDLSSDIHAEALAIFGKYNTGPLFTPPMEGKPTIYNPGWEGAANWMGCGVDPDTGIIYVPSQQGSISIELVRPDPARSNFTFIGKNLAAMGPQGLPLFKPPWGRITAIDMNTGDHVWMSPHGDGPLGHPLLKDVDIEIYLEKAELDRLGTKSRIHPLITKTLLITAAAHVGRGGRGESENASNFRAFDKATGAMLAEIALPYAFSGTPMTYAIDGRQYITIATGGMGAPSKLVTLALPK